MTLAQLAEKFGTDKLSLGYIPFYEELTRGKKIKRVLEIGVWRGYSLKMWEAYFPAAEIWGLDCTLRPFFSTTQIQTLECDQSNAASLEHAKSIVGTGFDLIIDDGSHEIADQILTAEKFLPLLAPAGAYVIEDVHPRHIAELIARFPPKGVVEFGHHPYYLVHLSRLNA